MSDTIICPECEHFSGGTIATHARCKLKAIDNPRAITCLNYTPATPNEEPVTDEADPARADFIRLVNIIESLFNSLDDRNAKIDRLKSIEAALNKQCYALQTKVTELNDKNESLSSRNSGLKKNNTSLVEDNRSLNKLLSKIDDLINGESE